MLLAKQYYTFKPYLFQKEQPRQCTPIIWCGRPYTKLTNQIVPYTFSIPTSNIWQTAYASFNKYSMMIIGSKFEVIISNSFGFMAN